MDVPGGYPTGHCGRGRDQWDRSARRGEPIWTTCARFELYVTEQRPRVRTGRDAIALPVIVVVAGKRDTGENFW